MFITIFTPTYNRANLLIRLFESLQKQQCYDFEWLIIDDGSIDNTESIVADLEKKSNFKVRYIRKENGGKHTAYNLALKEAKGDFFFTVDSDDWLPEDAIVKISKLVEDIKEDTEIAGILALKVYPSNKVIGRTFRRDNFNASFQELELMGESGERSLVFKTNIAKKFSFPVLQGEKFMTEAVMYDEYNKNYGFKICNETITICEYQIDGLSSNPRKTILNNPGGYYIYYRNRIDIAKSFKERVGYILRYNLFRTLYKGNEATPYKGKHLLKCKALSIFNPIVRSYYLYTSK